MSSRKRFRLFWQMHGREKTPRYHTALIQNPAMTLCKAATDHMETDNYEYQLPPAKTSCFGCLKQMKNYWPEKGSYYADGLK